MSGSKGAPKKGTISNEVQSDSDLGDEARNKVPKPPEPSPSEDKVELAEVFPSTDGSEKAAPRRKTIPHIVSNAPGKVNRTLESLAEIYKKKFPDRDCRWVYSPEHKRELSNTISRASEGYRKVRVKELDVELEDLSSDDVVRIGDVILMSITGGEKKELVEQRQELADEASRAVEREYYQTSEEMFDGVRTESDESSGRPRGRTKTEIRTHEYDEEQRTE